MAMRENNPVPDEIKVLLPPNILAELQEAGLGIDPRDTGYLGCLLSTCKNLRISIQHIVAE